MTTLAPYCQCGVILRAVNSLLKFRGPQRSMVLFLCKNRSPKEAMMSRLRRAGRRRRRSYASTKHQSVTSQGGTVFLKRHVPRRWIKILGRGERGWRRAIIFIKIGWHWLARHLHLGRLFFFLVGPLWRGAKNWSELSTVAFLDGTRQAMLF